MATFPEIRDALQDNVEFRRMQSFYDRCADIMQRSYAAMGVEDRSKTTPSSTTEIEISNESLGKTKVSDG